MATEEQSNGVADGGVVPDGYVESDTQIVPEAKREETRDSLVERRLRRDWTQGSIIKNLLQLSWPMTVTQTVMTLGPTIDMIWVGKLGDVAVAGVGVSGVVVQLAQGVMMGFTTGMRALIARAIGAKDMQTAHRVAQQAVVVSAVYAILMALIGHFFGEKIVRLITSDPEIISVGTLYLRIEFIGGATITFRMMMDAIMQASGDSVNPMWIALVYRLFHIALCPFLIFGWWIFPELGVRGAAYTSIIAQSLGVILGLRVLFGARSRVKLNFKGFHFDIGIIWRIIRIGFPSSISGIQRNLNQFFLQIFIAPFGAAALAAHVIVQRIEMLIFMPTMSFGMGAGVLVGQNLGAKKPERAEKSAWLAVGVVEAFVIAVSLALFVWTGPVIRLFNSDPSMDATATQFIHIAVAGWAFMGFMFVLMNSLLGAGDTMPEMSISVVTTWLITMPLAYFLPRHTSWGVLGIRWAMTASVIVGAMANIVYFRTGRWKTRRV
jgi:putative MATE family efflux protein